MKLHSQRSPTIKVSIHTVKLLKINPISSGMEKLKINFMGDPTVISFVALFAII